MISGSVANITYIVFKITFKMAVVTSSVAKIIFVENERAFKVALITYSVVNIFFVVTGYIFCWLTTVS